MNNNKIEYIVVIEFLDKVLRKEITRQEMNEMMLGMVDSEYDFLLCGDTFINKKSICYLDFLEV